MEYNRYLTIAVVALVTLYIVKHYLPSLAVTLGL